MTQSFSLNGGSPISAPYYKYPWENTLGTWNAVSGYIEDPYAPFSENIEWSKSGWEKALNMLITQLKCLSFQAKWLEMKLDHSLIERLNKDNTKGTTDLQVEADNSYTGYGTIYSLKKVIDLVRADLGVSVWGWSDKFLSQTIPTGDHVKELWYATGRIMPAWDLKSVYHYRLPVGDDSYGWGPDTVGSLGHYTHVHNGTDYYNTQPVYIWYFFQKTANCKAILFYHDFAGCTYGTSNQYRIKLGNGSTLSSAEDTYTISFDATNSIDLIDPEFNVVGDNTLITEDITADIELEDYTSEKTLLLMWGLTNQNTASGTTIQGPFQSWSLNMYDGVGWYNNIVSCPFIWLPETANIYF